MVLKFFIKKCIYIFNIKKQNEKKTFIDDIAEYISYVFSKNTFLFISILNYPNQHSIALLKIKLLSDVKIKQFVFKQLSIFNAILFHKTCYVVLLSRNSFQKCLFLKYL